MNTHGRIRTHLLTAATTLLLPIAVVSAQPAASPGGTKSEQSPTQRDGRHDFDFEYGTWKCHLKKLVKPLTGSKTWTDYNCTSSARPVWGGLANLSELHGEDPITHDRIDGLTLRLYNPQTHEWSIYWANQKNASLAMPPTVGHFNSPERGEFYDHEDWQGRPIVVRYAWSNITPSSAHFEQAFSPDEGKTWEVNWVYDSTRVTEK